MLQMQPSALEVVIAGDPEVDGDSLNKELDALRAENRALKEALMVTKRQRKRGAGRTLLIVFFLVLAAILAPLSVTAVWASNTISDTDRYADTVAPLADDPAIQDAVSKRITDELFNQIDVTLAVQNALPPEAQFLASPLSTQLKNLSQQTVKQVMGTDQFKTAWVAANKVAHQQVTGVLLDKNSEAVQTRDDKVVLDLKTLAVQARDQLSDTGITLFDKLPAESVTGEIVLINSPDVARAGSALKLLNTLRWILPILTLASFAMAIWISGGSRDILIASGLLLAAVMALYVLGLEVARSEFVTRTGDAADISSAAAAALFNTMTRFLLRGVETLLTLGLVVAIFSFFSGPYRPALWSRIQIGRLSAKLGLGAATGVGGFVTTYRRPLQMAVGGIPIVALLLWDKPTPSVVVWAAVIILLGLLTIEFLSPAPGSQRAESSKKQQHPSP